MTSLLQYFGVGAGKAAVEAQQKKSGRETVRALPAAWYTDEEMYQLERRAIFSKRWLFITASSRLPNPGDFLRYTIAGYDIVLIKDRSGTINAFHNVCRHRAYQVVEEDAGHKNILSCRYHGWSYGLNGNLAKAPAYDECEDFDKSKNGLFKIHTYIDSKGFVWINMDGNETPEIPWEQEFETVDTQDRFSKFNFEDYKLDHVYSLEGDYNWKIASDNFNECYHCKTTHADVPTFLTIDSHHVDVEKGHMQHDHASTPEQKAKGYDVNSTYYFPNVSMSVAPHFMMIQKFLPQGPTKSIMHYEVYRNTKSSDADFKIIADTYARVMGEDKVLCDKAQRNINAGVFVSGELHPRWEKGPLYIQQAVREVVVEHFNREKKAGQQIWPARQKVKSGFGSGEGKTTDEDMEICKALNCGQPQPQLAW